MAKTAKKYYAVSRGRTPGVYHSWFGPGGAREQVEAFPGARYKSFPTRAEAEAFVRGPGSAGPAGTSPKKRPAHPTKDASAGGAGGVLPAEGAKGTVVFSDGGCLNNPGPGGYGVVVLEGGRRTELSGGYRLTTNNRMELTGAIVGLRFLDGRLTGPVTVCTDSRYVVDGISKGWAVRWRSRGWMRDGRNRAENIDLWSVLLDLCDALRPDFVWVKGHAGHRENERCDFLAGEAARGASLQADEAYEKGQTGVSQPTLF